MGHLLQDLPCCACGYNLRGLTLTAECPECAAPVERTALGNWLKLADPQWVGRLARNVRLALAALVPAGVISIGETAARWVAFLPALSGAVSLVVRSGVLLAMVAGMWLLTIPDFARVGTEPALSARRLARWCSLSYVGAIAMEPFSGMWTRGTWFMPIAFIMGLAALLAQTATLWHVSTLAQRIPRAGLARWTRIVAWGYGISGGIPISLSVFFIWIVRAMSTGVIVPAYFQFMVWTMYVSVLAVMVFAVGALVLLFIYAAAFRRAAGEAAQFAATAG